MNDKLVREALKRLPTEALKRGMESFNHPPRASYEPEQGDACGCFVAATVGWRGESYVAPWTAFIKQLGEGGTAEMESAVSDAYELHQGELHAECVRELAERGSAASPHIVKREEETSGQVE